MAAGTLGRPSPPPEGDVAAESGWSGAVRGGGADVERLLYLRIRMWIRDQNPQRPPNAVRVRVETPSGRQGCPSKLALD